jgi:acetyl esterase/lipase
MSILFLVRLKVLGLALFAKLAAGALSPYWAVMGAAGAVLGWIYQAPWAIPMGIVGAGMMTRRRWSPFLKLKASPEPAWERDIPFWTIPDTERELLCDVWRPANGEASGLAIVYCHSSGWFAGDKDFGTRPFFHHLVAQGHTVMDVAYRLCPEVDIYGMVGDVKRAVAWMRANGSRYGVDPRKIALGGGSAGAHLALLAGYTPQHPELTPEDVKGADVSVCGILSYYGPTDLAAGYEPWRASNPFANLPPVPIGEQLAPNMRMRYAGRMDILLGGHPRDIPEVYRLASPPTHVGPGSPPTLLIQGDKDLLVPVETTRALHTRLVESGVPAINVVFPWTDHVFDLVLPQVSPPAQSALYDVDRFLALLANKD